MKPIAVKALKKYEIWVKFEDGSEGRVALSDLAGKPLFRFWDEGNNFYNVKINPLTGAIGWNDEIEICPDNVYIEINKLTPEEYFNHKVHAGNQ